MQVDVREVACGAVFLVVAALFSYGTIDLPLGTAVRMGPGYFPLMLAVILGILGAIIIVKGLGRAPSPFGSIPWRGILFICLGPIVFGLTVRDFGLVAAIALVAVIATLASARAGWRLAAILTITLTAFCVIVFSYGLGLPYALIGPRLAPFVPGV
ncbi:MAG: tripartite tricarboxylate transporter TctB family protein [Hansschlegelia sp.]